MFVLSNVYDAYFFAGYFWLLVVGMPLARRTCDEHGSRVADRWPSLTAALLLISIQLLYYVLFVNRVALLEQAAFCILDMGSDKMSFANGS